MSSADAADLALYGTPIRVSRAADRVGDRAGTALDFCAMRERMTADTDARVAVGGRLNGQSGRWPGILEEAYLALRAGQPLFVIGGLGGAASRVVCALRGEWPQEFTTEYQLQHTPGYEDLVAADVGTAEQDVRELLQGTSLANGLDDDENAALFETSDLDLIVALVLRGLKRTFGVRD
jgi:SLOG cluster2